MVSFMKNNKYKIIFLDIDDTLNVTNGDVTEYAKKVLKNIKKKGIKLVVCTGRSIQYAIDKAKEANLSNIVIASNGAEIYNFETKEIINEKTIDEEDVLAIYDYAQTHDMSVVLNCLEKRYVSVKDFRYNKEPAIYFDNIEKVLKTNNVNQIVLLSKKFDRMLVLPRLFSEKFPNIKFVHSSNSLIEEKRHKGKEYYHDLVVERTSKGNGVVELLDYLDIDSNEAICCGNGYDDISMADAVGLSIASGNACQKLKDISDIVAEPVEKDGVIKVLEKLLLQKD
jgi:Cof subfamily protein (haloacid dehalogenase superfamily)